MAGKAILAILDGWGIATNPRVSAIDQANTPFMDKALKTYPHTQLQASGLAVGLPYGQMGNSEVGHTNLGAGRVVYQNLVRINQAVESGGLLQEEGIQIAMQYAKEQGVALHFIGLTSDGGVHSHINHLKGLLLAAKQFGLQKIYVHAFTDGRDCDPHSAKAHLEDLLHFMKTEQIGQLASIVGRYYAMDRDHRWERVKIAYDALVHAIGTHSNTPLGAIQQSYDTGITDEFLLPIILTDEEQEPIAKIQNGDAVISFNFRTDRAREITEALTQKDFPEHQMHALQLHYTTLTNYDDTFQNVHVVFDEATMDNTLGQVLETYGKSQIRVAETEKYPHVTFFFSGGREEPFQGERRILCPSPKDVATYDLKPEMAAYDIVEKILPEIEQQTADFICLNFANTDMVGHTGVFSAAMKAAEIVDACIEKVAMAGEANGYTVFILADHGNSDYMQNPDGSPNTQHSTNLVPLIVIDKDRSWELAPLGKLGDIAPSILHSMGLSIPEEMTGEVLLS